MKVWEFTATFIEQSACNPSLLDWDMVRCFIMRTLKPRVKRYLNETILLKRLLSKIYLQGLTKLKFGIFVSGDLALI